ncbi:MAG: apolipoprotein N-acyltransferase [Treponema sp.]|nr:apolipoprotein N-acyltransferase [Treponema sp.]
MCRFLQVFCSLFSGVALALAIPNELLTLGSPIIGMFALAPFYVVLSRTKNYRTAFCHGWIMALTTHMLSSFWLGNFRGFALFTLGASALGTAFVCAFAMLVVYFPFSHFNEERRLRENAGLTAYSVPIRIFWFAGTYTVWEWAKSFGFLAYPWGTVSMTAYTMPLVTQIADITGPYGVTFLYTLVSASFAEGILLIPQFSHADAKKSVYDAWFSCVKVLAVLAGVVVLYGAYQYLIPRHPIKTLNAALVQQNLDPWDDTDDEVISISQRLSEEKINEFNAQNEKCDVVVWSEAVLSHYFPNAANYYAYYPEGKPLIPFIKKQGIPFIIGAPFTINREKHQYGNATVLLDKNGEYKGAYIKMHLVPFAERIPFVEYEAVRSFIKKIAGFSYGWVQGSRPVLFEIPISTPYHFEPNSTKIISLTEKNPLPESQSVMVSTPICFDDAFAEVCRKLYLAGSEVFINLTNDAWSQTDSAEWQHFAVASYRAIEYRTTLARSTNAGVTTIVDPTGKMLETLPLFKEDALAAKIPVYERKMTVYARLGDWLIGTLALLSLCYTVLFSLNEKDNEVKEISTSLIPPKRRRGRPRKNT